MSTGGNLQLKDCYLSRMLFVTPTMSISNKHFPIELSEKCNCWLAFHIVLVLILFHNYIYVQSVSN